MNEQLEVGYVETLEKSGKLRVELHADMGNLGILEAGED
jgi:hypothetical protein